MKNYKGLTILQMFMLYDITKDWDFIEGIYYKSRLAWHMETMSYTTLNHIDWNLPKKSKRRTYE